MDEDYPSDALYVFIDESGNFDFSDSGSNYFIIAAVITSRPLEPACAILNLRYQMLREGDQNVEFHATENPQAVRNRVYGVINSLGSSIEGHVLYLDKHCAAPAVQNEPRIMSICANAIARWLDKTTKSEYNEVVLVFDSVLTGKQRAAFLGAAKPVLKRLDLKYSISFQPVKSEPIGQIADYIAWAWSRKLERDDSRPKGQLSNLRISDFDLFRRNTRRYY